VKHTKKKSNAKTPKKRSWFGARTLYLCEIQGVDVLACSVEERVVLVRAVDGQQAIEIAEALAKKYEKELRWQNAAGETVVGRYLKVCDVFQMFAKPKDGAEVYSSTYLLRRVGADSEVVDRFFGTPEESDADEDRKRFVPDLERTVGMQPGRGE